MFSAYRFSKSSSFKIAASSNALIHAYTMLPLVSAWCRWLAISASSSRERQTCSRSTEDILSAVKEKKESFKLFPRSEKKALNNDSPEKANAIYRKKTKEIKGNHECRAFRQIAHDKIEETRCDFSRRRNCTEPPLTLPLPGVTNE